MDAKKQRLIEVLTDARSFVACGELNGHTEDCIFKKIDAVLADALATRDDNEDVYFSLAKSQHECEGELEIDDDAVVSLSDDGGAYVQAWVWVDKPLDSCVKCGTPIETGEEVTDSDSTGTTYVYCSEDCRDRH